MSKLESIEKLKSAILEFTAGDRHYSDLSGAEQRVHELCQALNTRLDHFKLEIERGGDEPAGDDGSEMEDLFHILGALAQKGALAQALSPENAAVLRETLSVAKQAGLNEIGLRKKDLAAYLRDSGDTDLMLQKHDDIDEAARKKDN